MHFCGLFLFPNLPKECTSLKTKDWGPVSFWSLTGDIFAKSLNSLSFKFHSGEHEWELWRNMKEVICGPELYIYVTRCVREMPLFTVHATVQWALQCTPRPPSPPSIGSCCILHCALLKFGMCKLEGFALSLDWMDGVCVSLRRNKTTANGVLMYFSDLGLLICGFATVALCFRPCQKQSYCTWA